ncbi:MAG: winged helix-turn-helix domain-containing protein [Alphaproteobacteria bacterium]|nr:winged helix-turn-helix domain-containing protein [Alphaproteobacteria bacterium]
MPEILLLIADNALRDAVDEQIAASRLGEVRPAVQGVAPDMVIADAAGWARGGGVEKQGEKPVFLLLGTGSEEEGSFAETFALPVRLGHLLMRMRYYLETAPLLRNRSVDFGNWRLEPQSRRAVPLAGGDAVRLTEKETALLAFLAARDAPASRRDILAAVWGYDERIDTHTLETHIYQLRRKLDAGGGDWLVSEKDGYRLARVRG